jgi:hypothetical protein
LFEHGLAKALCTGSPVVLRKRGRGWYAVASTRSEDQAALEPLRQAVGWGGKPAPVAGRVPGLDATWAEAVSIRLEERDGRVWLLLQPDIWIAPLSKRDQAVDFSRRRRLKRYNGQSNDVLDAWIDLLFPGVTRGAEATVTAFAEDDHPAVFKVNTRTAFSAGGQLAVS